MYSHIFSCELRRGKDCGSVNTPWWNLQSPVIWTRKDVEIDNLPEKERKKTQRHREISTSISHRPQMSRRREWRESNFSLADGSQVGLRQFHAGKSRISGSLFSESGCLTLEASATSSACRFRRQYSVAKTLLMLISCGIRLDLIF